MAQAIEDQQFHLLLKNRSIRHLKEIIIRNLNGPSKESLYCAYYKITLDLTSQSQLCPKPSEGEAVIYQSEVTENTLNPSWKNVSLDLPTNSSSCDRFTLTVFNNKDQSELYKEVINMKDLKILGNYKPKFLANLKTPLAFPFNTLFIHLIDGYYTIPSLYEFLHTQIPLSLLQPEPPEKFLVNPIEFIKNITFLENNKKKVIELRQRKKELIEKFNQKTKELDEVNKKSNEILHLNRKLESYIQQKDREKSLLDKEKEETEKCDNEIESINEFIHTSLNTITERYSHLSSYKTKIQEEKEKYNETCNLLEARRLKVLHHLRLLYPIKKEGDNYTIRDLILPENDWISIPEEMMASALGFTVHYVLMLAKYLEIPLKYELTFDTSQSYASDIAKDEDLIFPLNLKTGDRRTFDYGLFMLRRNIEQILYSQNLQLIKNEPLLSCLDRLEKRLLRMQ